MDNRIAIQRLSPHVEVGLIHWPACTNDPCTCLSGPDLVMVTRAFAEIGRMMNDRELKARVDEMWYNSGPIRATDGFDWYYDPNPFALYTYVGFLFI